MNKVNLTAKRSVITEEQIRQSVADALQFISYYHPEDYIRSLTRAYEKEKSAPARDAMAQILINSRMCAEGHRPICQDTGIVTVFVEIGMNVVFEAAPGKSLEDIINEGVREAYSSKDNPLRASIVSQPAGKRTNTRDNTPAVTHIRMIPGDTVHFKVAAKGGGSEVKAKFAMLNPSDSIADWILQVVPEMGAGWCPPGMLGIGIGGTAEKAMQMAKEALMDPINIQELVERGPSDYLDRLRLEIYDRVNNLGIGAQGLGGLTTVLDVKILEYPTHAANLPVAVIPNCAATRHIEFSLDGSGVAEFTPPDPGIWPDITYNPQNARRIDLNTFRSSELASFKAGDVLLLSGKLLTGRDAAHKRIQDMLSRGEPLPVSFKGRFIYYVGPVDPVEGEAVGPAGPTTSTRMDKFTRMMIEDTGLTGMVGKAERGQEAIDAIRDNGVIYLMAVGGAAYLVSRAIKSARLLAFEDLGMEAIYEFDVTDMPVTVAVDSSGVSIHQTGPALWKGKVDVQEPVS
ncbi:TPA: fumarate hydratase [Klebsiella pneumoniae]|nr:fumarate hydratase [Klebsiella pneumoniae]HBT1563853.1 fumarate hydratase [Klebsiella pneumoniae]